MRCVMRDIRCLGLDFCLKGTPKLLHMGSLWAFTWIPKFKPKWLLYVRYNLQVLIEPCTIFLGISWDFLSFLGSAVTYKTLNRKFV